MVFVVYITVLELRSNSLIGSCYERERVETQSLFEI